jgi:hypothetical protein
MRTLLDEGKILGVQTHRPTAIYYLAADRPWHPTYARAFHAAGLKDGDVEWYALMDPGTDYDPRKVLLRSFSAFDFLQTEINRFKPKPGSVIFIDPLAPLFVQGEQNTSKNVAVSLQWVRRCCQPAHMTAICDTNVTKLKADEDFKRPQDRLAGSGAFLAYSDTVFNLTQEDMNSPVRTLCWYPRMSPPGKAQFTFDPVTAQLVPFIGLQDEGDTPDTDRPTQVLMLFPPEPDEIEFGDLFDLAHEAFKTSKASLKRDLTVLIKRGLVVKGGWGAYQRRKLI